MAQEIVKLDEIESCDATAAKLRALGYRTGYRNTCRYCGNSFIVARGRFTKVNRNQFCSRKCVTDSLRGKRIAAAQTYVPESTKPERIRANGLINMRLRRGAQSRPSECVKCDRECRPDAHHPDYAKPDLVAWLCRSCHMKAHRDKAFEQECAKLAAVVPVRSETTPDPAPNGAPPV